MEEAAFYSYAYPAPEGFAAASAKPDYSAFFASELGEFLLPYEAMRTAPDPDQALRDFLTGTYDAAADLGQWDRVVLDGAIGRPCRPRTLWAAVDYGSSEMSFR